MNITVLHEYFGSMEKKGRGVALHGMPLHLSLVATSAFQDSQRAAKLGCDPSNTTTYNISRRRPRTSLRLDVLRDLSKMSITTDKVLAASPNTERGHPTQLSADPKGERLAYAVSLRASPKSIEVMTEIL